MGGRLLISMERAFVFIFCSAEPGENNKKPTKGWASYVWRNWFTNKPTAF